MKEYNFISQEEIDKIEEENRTNNRTKDLKIIIEILKKYHGSDFDIIMNELNILLARCRNMNNEKIKWKGRDR